MVAAIGALIPIALAVLPGLAGIVATGLIIAFEVAICLSVRGSLTEWAVVIAIGFVLFALALPAVNPHQSRRNPRNRPSPTSSPGIRTTTSPPIINNGLTRG